ncbi:hypothetical protein PUN28_001694 [Cardiocondyla obscurior]|uniref:DUF4797 domain-containing protein n=1 Tax=Cardiocondyla obscurior TaxID=286306 RepID=A0AAW2GQT4_9HYME
MEESSEVKKQNDHRQHHSRYHHHHHHQYCRRGRITAGEIGDDEMSTDSGCSSGGSMENEEYLSRQDSRLFLKIHRYPEGLRGRPTRSQERLNTNVQRSLERSWSFSPEDVSFTSGGASPLSYSSTPSDAHSSSDSDSLKRISTTETLRRVFQNLKVTTSKWDLSNKERKYVKNCSKRILRSPIPCVYVRGPSGLPTQRIPRNATFQN